MRDPAAERRRARLRSAGAAGGAAVMRKPLLSLVVAGYNMARELPRTVASLLPPYQRDVDFRFEIIVVENGSQRPVPGEVVSAWPRNVRHELLAAATPSPAAAMNHGVSLARGRFVGLLIDGARLASPGLLREAVAALRAGGPRTLAATVGFHLGSRPQQESTLDGYDQAAEDRLLDAIAWRQDGYRLFGASSLALSSARGWFAPPPESNALFMSRSLFGELGGFDTAFVQPGGGLVNHDFLRRAVALPGIEYLLLLGEATFHQIHGGISTNPGRRPAGGAAVTWEDFAREYEAVRGRPYEPPDRMPVLFGRAGPSVLPWLKRTAAL